VTVPDTVRGLILLGLEEKFAKYAAYALHAIFSYPTSENWLPGLNSALPIHIARMGSTRWGKNWGTFERIEWVDDVEIYRVSTSQPRKRSRLTELPNTVFCVSRHMAFYSLNELIAEQ
jgi:hypothetical protein